MDGLKRCFKCGVAKPRSAFYRHPHMADGLLGKCKECTRRDVRLDRLSKLEEKRAYDRERGKQPHRIASTTLVTRRWRAAHPGRARAHNIAARAKMTKPAACEGCGREDVHIEKHHPDYSEPMFFVWLCKPCHAIADKIRRKQEAAKATA